jgi:NADH-quinone oxidoreductase subunit C
MAENASPDAPHTPATTNESSIKTELAKLRAAQGDAILEVEEDARTGMYWITVKPRSVCAVAKLLRDDRALDYKLICDITCIDRPEREKRFCVVYNLYSVSRGARIFLRVHVGDGEKVPTLTPVYVGANWAEREVMDLFGVIFEGHPDPRKILVPDDWTDFPLRKDFPIVGKKPVLLFNDVKDIL